jgi:hypothetical protein
MAKAKLQYHGEEPVGYCPPINDLHGRWLVPPRLTTPDAPDVARVFQPEETFFLDEVRDIDALQFLRSVREFQLLTVSRQYG